MFNIEPGTFKPTVKIHALGEDDSEVATVDVTYNVMPVSRSAKMEPGQDVVDFVHETVAKIEGLVDEKGEPLEWTPEVEAKFWDLPHVLSHIQSGYIDALEEARAKN
ncbi:MAG: hypothetical protein GQ535_14850 [Rhodobacteraceae bacterium]|nr:hypothetical protein [Paracoccaceae bacterium]